MRKFLALCLILSSFFIGAIVFSPRAYSDELDDLSSKINDLQKQLSESQKATKPLESQLTSIQTELRNIENRVITVEKELVAKKKSIDTGYKELETQQDLLNQSIRNLYMRNYSFSPILVFVSSNNASDITKTLVYQKKGADQDKALITNIALRISDLEEKQKDLQSEEKKLAAIKIKLDGEREKVATVVKGAKDYQATLSKQLAELSAKQQALLAQKLGSLNLPSSLGAGPLSCVDDRKLDPGFGSGLAFYTFGIPHRVGLNQYGAHGRGKAGQNYEQILMAYFANSNIESVDTNTRIKVQGYGEMSIEDYMLGIYEMPNSFHPEALKAQAVAARSYALAYTGMGSKEICTTQACQVYKGGNKGGEWEKAVRDTAGKVLKSNGEVVTAWFASTAGGYLFSNNDVWGGSPKSWTKRFRDTDGDVNSFDDLIAKSYDRDSPCLYAAQGSRAEFNKSAWLKPSEVADIVNVLQLAKKDSGTQTHLSQVDKPNPDGTDTWDAEKVKQELKNRGGQVFNSISSASIDWDRGLGRTNSITLNGDAGSVSFNGDEFKQYFNLRAPANIQIVGPLYNVERR